MKGSYYLIGSNGALHAVNETTSINLSKSALNSCEVKDTAADYSNVINEIEECFTVETIKF